MQLEYNLFKPMTTMETSNIKSDIQSLSSDDELSICIKAIGKNQDKQA